MKSITFMCTKSAAQIENEARQGIFIYKLTPWLCLVCIGIIGFLYYSSVLQGPHVQEDKSLDLFVTLILGISALILGVIGVFFFRNRDRAGIKYDLMPDKQFGWDEEAQQFFYKDKNRSLRFTGKDVQKWNSYIQGRMEIPMDIFLLKTGERIILEGDWNENVHEYLNKYHNLFGLSNPSGMVWMFDIYKDEPTPNMKNLIMCLAAVMMAAGVEAKTLVAYFSATGTTKAAAERIVKELRSQGEEVVLWEIEPAEKYSSADLNWRDKQSRSSIEMADEEARPMIKRCTFVTPYETIYVGYPIWWGICPRIINSWLDNNVFQLEGKTLIPFATSGSSGVEQSVEYLRKTYPTLNWRDGRLMNE